MPKYKLTNVVLSSNKSKLDAIKCLQKMGYIGGAFTLLPILNNILDNGFTIETYWVNEVAKYFSFSTELVESDEETADRLYKETRQAEMDAAIAWRNGLSKREQEYINVLGRNYIATAH